MERNKNLKQLSQNLRKNMTKEELLLWNTFLRKYPIQFRRQYIIGSFITDFYCHRAKLVVELDGSQHYEPTQQIEDDKRTAYLEAQGLTVLRFTNAQVMGESHNVCCEIDRVVQAKLPQHDACQAHIPSPEGKVPRRGG